MKSQTYEPTRDNAAFVAMMLSLPVSDIFPYGAETGEEADRHFIETVINKVDELTARLTADDDSTEMFAKYRGRVLFCQQVLNGKVLVPRDHWAGIAESYGRGIYLSRVTHHRRGPRA